MSRLPKGSGLLSFPRHRLIAQDQEIQSTEESPSFGVKNKSIANMALV